MCRRFFKNHSLDADGRKKTTGVGYHASYQENPATLVTETLLVLWVFITLHLSILVSQLQQFLWHISNLLYYFCNTCFPFTSSQKPSQYNHVSNEYFRLLDKRFDGLYKACALTETWRKPFQQAKSELRIHMLLQVCDSERTEVIRSV